RQVNIIGLRGGGEREKERKKERKGMTNDE
ncbi:MAG: hypothetical protein RLZZ292_199, partial [Bacteroidota bacterium]